MLEGPVRRPDAQCSPPWRRCVGTTSRRSGTSPSCPARRRSRRRCAASCEEALVCTSLASRTRGPTAARRRVRLLDHTTRRRRSRRSYPRAPRPSTRGSVVESASARGPPRCARTTSRTCSPRRLYESTTGRGSRRVGRDESVAVLRVDVAPRARTPPGAPSSSTARRRVVRIIVEAVSRGVVVGLGGGRTVRRWEASGGEVRQGRLRAVDTWSWRTAKRRRYRCLCSRPWALVYRQIPQPGLTSRERRRRLLMPRAARRDQ